MHELDAAPPNLRQLRSVVREADVAARISVDVLDRLGTLPQEWWSVSLDERAIAEASELYNVGPRLPISRGDS